MPATDRAAAERQASLLWWGKIIFPVLGIIATFVGMGVFHAGPGSLTAQVTSPLVAAFALGLAMFPGSAFFFGRALAYWAQRREAAFWPAVKGHVIDMGADALVALGPFVRVRYVVNGHLFTHDFLLARPYPAIGAEVDVHVNLETGAAVVLAGDSTLRTNILTGLGTLVAPFILGPILVWWSS
jgi:hypothetical protein